MNILTESFKVIDDLIQEFYPGTNYNIIVGTGIKRKNNNPTAAMALSADSSKHTVIEIHPDMSLALVVKSVLRLLSQLVSFNLVGDDSICDHIEDELFQKYTSAIADSYANMEIGGVGQSVIN